MISTEDLFSGFERTEGQEARGMKKKQCRGRFVKGCVVLTAMILA